jgi:hypothetical protein
VCALVARATRPPAVLVVLASLAALVAGGVVVLADMLAASRPVLDELLIVALVLALALAAVYLVFEGLQYAWLVAREDDLVQLVSRHLESGRASPQLARLLARHASIIAAQAQAGTLLPLVLVALLSFVARLPALWPLSALALLFLLLFAALVAMLFRDAARSSMACIILRGIADYEEPAGRMLALYARERDDIRRLLRYAPGPRWPRRNRR